MLDQELRGTNALIVETFDNNSHVFYCIEEDGLHYFKMEGDSRLITRLIIKPDLWVFFKNGGYDHGVSLLKPIIPSIKKNLAMNFYIDPDIFDDLIKDGLISYSKAMADLYNLPISYSRDIQYHRNDYKRTKNKEMVLSKMKQGVFN